MKIVIINQPINNRGDEAAHRSLIRGLNREFPEASITILLQTSSDDSFEQIQVKSPKNGYLNNLAFNRGAHFAKRWGIRTGLLRLSMLHPSHRTLVNLIRNADLVVCAPGGICMGGFQDWGHIYNLMVAKYFNKKIVYYSRSFGPFPTETRWNQIFKKESIELLKYFDFLSIRDSKSMTLADEIGIQYIPSIDTAFLDSPKAEIPHEIKNLIAEREYIVFVPNSLTWHYSFANCDKKYLESFYLDLINLLLKKYPDTNIVMLPQLYNLNEHGDENYFKKLKSYHGDSRIIIIPEKYGSDIQQTIISKAKLMVGARYHSIVFAINNEVPFVALSYEHKISGLLEILNLKKYMYDIEKLAINPPDIKNIIADIEDILAFTTKSIEAKNEAQTLAKSCLINFIERYKKN